MGYHQQRPGLIIMAVTSHLRGTPITGDIPIQLGQLQKPDQQSLKGMIATLLG